MQTLGRLWYCRCNRWALREASLFLLSGNVRESCGVMLVGTLQLRSALRQMVNEVTRHSALQRELMEECLVYLAKLEAVAPDRDAAWYLQRCSRHLSRFRYLARSWEEPKLPPAMVEKTTASLRRRARTAEEIHRFSEVVAVLSKHLSKRETKVLVALAEGSSLEEVAKTLKEELPEIVRAQRKIAALILKLGLAPKPVRPRRKARAKAPGGNAEPAQAKSGEVEASGVVIPPLSPQTDAPRDGARPS